MNHVKAQEKKTDKSIRMKEVSNMITRLAQLIKQSNSIVFFGGAGVSTESGIPDFRSQSGIFSHQHYPYPAETMVSADFFYAHPDQFYHFYFHEMIYPEALPNHAHRALAFLEQAGKLSAVITQNIDGLHQAAGSQHVLELHGSVHRNRCMHCHAFYDLAAMLAQKDHIPLCPLCGHMIKPEVVLYGEALDQALIEQALAALAQADLLIVGGTSLAVYPAAGLLTAYQGEHIVLINRDVTSLDHRATLAIHEPIAQVMDQLIETLSKEP